MRPESVRKGNVTGPDADEAVATPRWRVRLATLAATDLSSAVYGSLLVTALVVIEMQSDASAEFVGASTAVAVAVFWLAHVWAQLVNLRLRRRVTRREVLESASAEFPMLLSAIPPVVALALSRAGGATVGQAEAVALVVAVGELFAWGLAVGRVAGRGWGAAAGIATVDVGLGLLIVALKAVVH